MSTPVAVSSSTTSTPAAALESTPSQPATYPPPNTIPELAPLSDPTPTPAAAATSLPGQDRDGASIAAASLSEHATELVYLKVLIISGLSHVFSFEPEITVGRMVRCPFTQASA